MEKRPNIVCAGTLDTKGAEILYLAEQVKMRGGNPIIMDVSLGKECGGADISLREILSMTGNVPEDLFVLARTEAAAIVSRAAEARLLLLFRQGQADGIIGWAGGIGTTIVTHMMRALPIGVPKVMLSAGTSGNIGRWLGASDIYFSNPVSEMGINRITRQTVENGVCAVVAMARERMESEVKEQPPVAAVTLYKNMEAMAGRCREHMKGHGMDTLYFYQTGAGAVMEELIRAGEICAVFDLTPGELVNNFFQSETRNPDGWTGIRFTAAFDAGIPVVAAPGGLCETPFGKWELLPETIRQEFADGKRKSFQDTGLPFFETDGRIILPTTLQENRKFAHMAAARLNRAKGPVLFLIPMRGWSAYDRGGPANREGAVWLPDTVHPAWSARAVQMQESVEIQLCPENPKLKTVACDLHILDEKFSELACFAMDRMLDGTWEKGMLREFPHVLKKI